MKAVWFSLSCLGLCLAISGCGGGDEGGPVVERASGIVTYKGAAVEGARVTFVVDGASHEATAMTNSKGEFNLTTLNTSDGAVVGKNLVSISKPTEGSAQSAGGGIFEMSKLGAAPDPETMKKMTSDLRTSSEATSKNMGKAEAPRSSAIPLKYSDAKKSGLEFSVAKGEKNHFKIDLKD